MKTVSSGISILALMIITTTNTSAYERTSTMPSKKLTSNESKDIPRQYRQNLDGFTQIVIDTEDEQKDPLIKVISIEIPSSIINTGQAVNYVLYSTGYQLLDLRETTSETLGLYSKRVPLVNRSFFRSTVKQVIETLIGSAFFINVDRVSRQITIEAKEA